MRFADVSIRGKVLFSFGMILLVTIGLGLFAIHRLGAVNDAAAELRDNWLPSTLLVGKLATMIEQYRVAEGRHILSTTAELGAVEADLKTRLETIRNLRASYEPMITPGEERRLIDAFDKAWTDYLAFDKDLLGLSRREEKDVAGEIYKTRSRATFAAARDSLKGAADLNEREGVKAANNGASIFLSARLWILAAIVLAAVLCTIMGWLIVGGVSRPIAAMTGAMRRLAARDMAAEIVGIGRKDEIGQMASAVQVFKDNMAKADELAAQQHAEQARKEARNRAVEGYITDFDRSVASVLQMVSSASTELQSTATSMTSTAQETTRRATAAAAASEQASGNVQTVASAAEELSSSIAEIGRQVADSARIAGEASRQADRTNARIQGLADSARKIGEVVKMITDIAGQTNLLALNATIEAARAGEAGKGFAVVASEVKSLATQTAKATEEIGAKIAEIQGATGDSVQAVQTIGETISKINEITTGIASAIEQQGAATQEIARNVQQASQGTAEVSTNISGVTQAASEAAAAANQVLGASSELSKQSETLRAQVNGFLGKIRAA